VGSDIIAPIDGLSKTANLSLKPCVAIDNFGDPTIAWMDGASGRFDILLKQFSPNGPGVTSGVLFNVSMRQTLTDPFLGAAVDLAPGGATAQTTVFLSARVFTETLLPAGTAIRIEVEVQPSSSGFKGTPTAQSLIVVPDSPSAVPGNQAVVAFSGLPDTVYKWQCRTVDQKGRHSPWFPFPQGLGGAFRIDTAPPPSVTPGGPSAPTFIATTKSKGSCGLLGLEALLALGLLRVIRRKR
jgi:hypothetical protein